MQGKLLSLAVALCWITVTHLTLLHAQPYVFTTIAGLAGQNGFNDGVGAAARFHWPEYLATDNAGNVYVSDTANNAVRMLTHTAEGWNVRTIAGSPPFSSTKGILVDEQTNVFVADFSNGFIRKLTPSGTNWIVSTVSDAPGPWGLARDATGNLYYSDYVYDVIRRLSPVGTNWVSSILAGTPGTFGSVDGTNGEARFADPQGLAVDSSSNVYVAEYWSDTVRKIAPVGTNWVVTTIAGTSRVFGGADGTNGDAVFSAPEGVALDGSGNLFVTDAFNQAIRKITPVGTDWVVTTIGGLLGFDNSGSADGVGADARFHLPSGVAADRFGNIYIADTQNSTIRCGTPLRLSIERIQAQQVLISWPLLATGFVLEASSTLPAASWTTISNGIVAAGDKYFLTNDTSDARSFYRLRK